LHHSFPCIYWQNQISRTHSYLRDGSKRGHNGGMEIRGTNKFKGTSTMKRVDLPIVESCKVEGKLLITSKILWIKWNANEEFPICTTKNIFFNSLSSVDHEPKKTLVVAMSNHERLHALTYNYKRELLLPWSLMGSKTGFWRRSKVESMSIFKSYFLRWTIQNFLGLESTLLTLDVTTLALGS
jgi:hypothetical protein